VWEDHVRYAITREEWDERRHEFEERFFSERSSSERLT
jgi:hypothetical protein